jgi:predicted ABC-type ATPase
MKRIRLFAGPNGSGKSTLVKQFIESDPWLINTQLHIDPDKLNLTNVIDFGNFGIQTDISEFKEHLLKSTLFPISKINISDIKFENSCLINDPNNPYMGSLLADFIRDKLIDLDINLFSFETVFSHESKIEFMKRAKQKGWELYLYFVSTSDAAINQGRVNERVEKGQHDVPDDKIKNRYVRSNDLLYDALKLCRRAYIFDNSNDASLLIAEKDTDGTILIKDGNQLPQWVDTYLFSKLELYTKET